MTAPQRGHLRFFNFAAVADTSYSSLLIRCFFFFCAGGCCGCGFDIVKRPGFRPVFSLDFHLLIETLIKAECRSVATTPMRV